MICREWMDNLTTNGPSAGAGARFRSMSTKAPSSNSSTAPRAPEQHKDVPENISKFIDALSRTALGRVASVEEMGELAESIEKKPDRRAAVQSVLLMEEALLRLAEPWFWKL